MNPLPHAAPTRQLASRAVHPIGLGCMGMSEFYGATDDAESLATLHAALDLGVTHFDTADTYGHGHNEQLLGRFLAEIGPQRRAQTTVATKFGIVRQPGAYERRIDNSPAYIRSACEASLQRLGVDCIDLYYCHRRDTAVPIAEVVGAMAELVRAGKVRSLQPWCAAAPLEARPVPPSAQLSGKRHPFPHPGGSRVSTIIRHSFTNAPRPAPHGRQKARPARSSCTAPSAARASTKSRS